MDDRREWMKEMEEKEGKRACYVPLEFSALEGSFDGTPPIIGDGMKTCWWIP
mgnify:CR=1 FL=1